MSTTIRSVLIAAFLIAGSFYSRAGVLQFDASCDNFWNTCCDCGVNMKCNNWSVPASIAPLCPSLPSLADDLTITLPCTIQAGMSGTAGTLQQSGSTFTLNGNLSVNTDAAFDGPVLWNSGTIARASSNVAMIDINNDMTIQGSDQKFLGGNAGLLNGGVEVVNNSTITWSGSGGLQMGPIPGNISPATLRTTTGNLFDVRNDSSIIGTGFGLGRIDVEGTLQKSAGSGVSDWNVILRNSGLVHVQTGSLKLDGSGEASGEFRIDAGAQLTFATVFFFEFKPGIEFTGDGDVVLVDTGSNVGILVQEDIELNRLRVENSGAVGPTSNFGSITMTELLEVDGARFFPPVIIASGARLVQDGPNESFFGDLNIAGEVDIIQGNLSTSDRTLTVEPSGVVEIRDGAALRTAGLSNLPIQNNGTIQKTTGNGTASVLADFFELFFNNAGGLIHVGTGTLDFVESNIRTEGGTWQIDEGATLRAPGSFGQLFELNIGIVRGGGTLIVNRLNNNGGTVAPGDSPGVLTIAGSATPARPGDYLQGNGGTLDIEVGGLTVATQHDQLAVAGTATLGGTLKLTLIDGFVPQDEDEITVLTAGTRTGEFTNIDTSTLPSGISAEAEYSATAVIVRFTGQPTDNGNENSSANGNSNSSANVNGNTSPNSNSAGNGNSNSGANNSNDNSSANANSNSANSNDNSNDGPGAPMMMCGNCGAGMAMAFPLWVSAYGTFLGFRIRNRRRNR